MKLTVFINALQFNVINDPVNLRTLSLHLSRRTLSFVTGTLSLVTGTLIFVTGTLSFNAQKSQSPTPALFSLHLNSQSPQNTVILESQSPSSTNERGAEFKISSKMPSKVPDLESSVKFLDFKIFGQGHGLPMPNTSKYFIGP